MVNKIKLLLFFLAYCRSAIQRKATRWICAAAHIFTLFAKCSQNGSHFTCMTKVNTEHTPAQFHQITGTLWSKNGAIIVLWPTPAALQISERLCF